MKILFAISLLAIVAAAALAFMARSSMRETRDQKDEINKEIVKIHEGVEKVNLETVSVWDSWKTTKGLAKDEDTFAKKLNRETSEQDDILKDLAKQIDEIKNKRADMEKQIADAIGDAGGTPEEVVSKVEALKGETDALTQELDTLTKELDIAKKQAGESDDLSGKLKAQQTARLKAIQLGGRSSTITAVNPEFSFVTVNIGRRDGLTMDARLLVKRGGQLIGHLNIVSIDQGVTVADIDLKRLLPGAQIQPGDEVVVENSVR